MTQYFAFKKSPNESISSFLVRETLSYEEFQEALIRLHEKDVQAKIPHTQILAYRGHLSA